jgi:peptidoglycan-associated lipoprotein
MTFRPAYTFTVALALAGTLGACGTSKPPATTSGTGTQSSSPASPGSAQTAPVQQAKPGAGMPAKPQAGGARMHPLDDPNNLLSKRSVFYDFDKSDIKSDYRALVEAHARYLRDNPNARVTVEGNCDERGSREYNVALGQRRAEGVKKAMVLLGARDQQLEAVSFGEEKPRSAGHDESAWSQNRRSDLTYNRRP